VLGLALVAVVGVTSRADTAGTGPALSEPPAALAAALRCSPDVTAATRSPVLLVHATAVDSHQWDWNWIPALTAAHVPYCTVELLDKALGDIQASAEYVVHAIRTVHAMSGRRIDIVGHSQGGMVPRWALKYWPETRAMVDDVIGIAASNHGTVVGDGYCALPCPPANRQQGSNTAFIKALNEGAETWAGISYTDIYTHYDEIVFPNLDATGSTSLHTGDGVIANVAIQDICPLAATDHIGIGLYDPIAWALAVDAIDHDGPADPGRVPPSACVQPFMPGVNPATFATDYTATVAGLGVNLATARTSAAEPPLRCYVTDSCAAADVGAAPAATTAPPAPAPARAEVRGATLAATGVDLDGRAATALVLLGLAVVTRRMVRST
jgi:hypothetical protein